MLGNTAHVPSNLSFPFTALPFNSNGTSILSPTEISAVDLTFQTPLF